MSQPPYSGPPYGEQPSSGQPHQGQPPYQGQPYPGQPPSGQPQFDQSQFDQPQFGQQPPAGPPYPGQQPYSGQPYSGQPNPDVPTSVPPGYPPTQAYPGAPEYGQPQYGQQQYGQPQYGEQTPFGQPQYGDQGYGAPGFPPVPPKKKSKALPIVLVSVAVVLVLCVGGSFAIYLAAKNKVDANKDSVNTSSTTTPTGGATSEPAAKNGATIKITEPKTLGGRPKLTDAQFAGVAQQLQNSLKDLPGATNSVGALYGSVTKRNIVIVAAAEAPIENPAQELNQTFYGAGIGGLKIENITSASTGSLGGSAKCGSANSQGVDMVLCAWADDGSLGMVIWYFKSASKAKAEFPTLRAEVEHKS